MSQINSSGPTGLCPECKEEVYRALVKQTGKCPACKTKISVTTLQPAPPTQTTSAVPA